MTQNQINNFILVLKKLIEYFEEALGDKGLIQTYYICILIVKAHCELKISLEDRNIHHKRLLTHLINPPKLTLDSKFYTEIEDDDHNEYGELIDKSNHVFWNINANHNLRYTEKRKILLNERLTFLKEVLKEYEK